MRKLCLFVFIVLLSVLTIFAQSGRVKQSIPVPTPSPEKFPPRPPGQTTIRVPDVALGEIKDIPDYVVYETVFDLAKKGWALEEVKFNPDAIRICQRWRIEKVLNEKQEKFLRQVAEETFTETNKIDKKFEILAKEFRAKRFRGENPEFPPETEELNQQRIKIIESGIKKLKENFSEKNFAKFAKFVDEKIRPTIHISRISIPSR